jgi:TusA-related sulfurtransferase
MPEQHGPPRASRRRLTAPRPPATMSLMAHMAPETGADNTDRPADRLLDITHLVCPMTFVRTKLAIEQMAAGEVLEVRMNAGEPLENVPRSVREMGHQVLSLEPEPEAKGRFRLRIAIR